MIPRGSRPAVLPLTGKDDEIRLTDTRRRTANEWNDASGTVLYQLRHLATFLTHQGRGLPAHVRRELDRFLDSGILQRGFSRVHCPACNQSALVAFA